MSATVVTVQKPSLMNQAQAALNRMRLELSLALMLTVVFLSTTLVGAQTEPDPPPINRPTLELDVDTMLYYMFEGANIIIVALGAVVFLTIGFVLGRKILDLIRQAISSL